LTGARPMRCTSNHCRSRRRLKPCRDPLIRAAISVLKGGATSFDVDNSARNIEFRIQRDGADEPAGQTTANYAFPSGGDNLNELPVVTQAIPSLTAANAYTIDLDASTTGSAGSVGQQRSLMGSYDGAGPGCRAKYYLASHACVSLAHDYI
jgi:hypothetical protein